MITVDKAIEILAQCALTYPEGSHSEVLDAFNLGIEALKEVREARLMGHDLPHTLLPGETKE